MKNGIVREELTSISEVKESIVREELNSISEPIISPEFTNKRINIVPIAEKKSIRRDNEN